MEVKGCSVDTGECKNYNLSKIGVEGSHDLFQHVKKRYHMFIVMNNKDISPLNKN